LLLRGAFFINCFGLDIRRCPVIELLPVEADTALTYWELADIWAHGFVEFGSAHAQVDGGGAGADEAGEDAFASEPGRHLRQFYRHKCSMPRVAAEGGDGNQMRGVRQAEWLN
jgi:hypothetical protein